MNSSRLLAATRLLISRRAVRFLASALLAAGAVPLHAFAGTHTSSTNGEINPAAIYHNYCSVCHGDKGDGRSRAQNSLMPPPRDFTTSAAATQLTRARMIESVSNGRSGTAMIGWKSQLNKKEIEAVVDYIRNTYMPANASNDSDRGRVVYTRNCAVCHGDKGDGRSRAQNSLNPPPRDFTAAAAKVELTQQRMINSVTYGRPETAMAGFKSQLSKEDIEAVVSYIRGGFMASGPGADVSGTRHGKAGLDSTPARTPTPTPAAPKAVEVNMSAPMPNALKGDVVKGAAFYMSNCATCHGTTGDGRGPRAYFINPKPRNFLHPASRASFNRVALYNAVTEGKLGTEMPAWGKVLSPQEVADVSEFVFQRFIQAKQSK